MCWRSRSPAEQRGGNPEERWGVLAGCEIPVGRGGRERELEWDEHGCDGRGSVLVREERKRLCRDRDVGGDWESQNDVGLWVKRAEGRGTAGWGRPALISLEGLSKVGCRETPSGVGQPRRESSQGCGIWKPSAPHWDPPSRCLWVCPAWGHRPWCHRAGEAGTVSHRAQCHQGAEGDTAQPLHPGAAVAPHRGAHLGGVPTFPFLSLPRSPPGGLGLSPLQVAPGAGPVPEL